jgi:pSer/pThr/pTyr-binding forkhead associated (FHA) protein
VVTEFEKFVLRVEGSSGATVNGQPVTVRYELEEGDIIDIAFTTLRFTTQAPAPEMAVISRDTPTPLDDESPTRSTIRAANREAIIGDPEHVWRRLWRWLTRRPNTE